MGHNRYIPYGYRIHMGSALPSEEAEIVRQIYTAYRNGESFQGIANSLRENGVRFDGERCDWNKNRVKRILEDERYIGKSGYPTLLSEDEFRQVQAIIASRRPREYMTHAETAIRNRVRCAECGRRFKRFAASAARVWWKCEEKECRTDFKITPDMLFHAIASLIDMVIDDPKLLTVPDDPAQGFRPNTETVRVNHEINRLLEKPDADRQTLTSLILKGISVRYAACGADSAPYTTEKLKDAFAIAEPTGRIQPELIEKSVSAILVAHDGRIRVRFINGAVVSGRIEPRKERT